MIKCETSPL